MAPSLTVRDYVRCNIYGNCYRYSSWDYYGRWILAGVAIFVFCLIISCLLCARQRQRRGQKPLRGTGWMAPAPKYSQNNANNYQMHGQNQHQAYPPQDAGAYGQQQGYYGAPPPPPPAYGQQQQGQFQQHQPQYTGTTFQSNDGYYAQGQTNGVQSPPGAYNPQDPYAPPPGPPK